MSKNQADYAFDSGARPSTDSAPASRSPPPAPGSATLVSDDAALVSATARLAREQMQVNEALVAKIFQCQRAEEALRASEEKLHELLAHQLHAKEEERKRIAREIHDTLGQNLMALRMDLSALHLRTSVRHARMHQRSSAALDTLDGAIRAVRTIIADLRPFQIDLGLDAAVEWELNKFKRSSGIASHLAVHESVAAASLTDEQTAAIYRIFQECLSNIFRHSLATRIDVALRAANDVFMMSVSDNGVGFDPAKPRRPSAYGLLGMQERLAAIGGELSLRSAEHHGTTVSIAVPLDAPGAEARTRRTRRARIG